MHYSPDLIQKFQSLKMDDEWALHVATNNAQFPKRAAAAAADALNDGEGDAHDLHDGFV